MRKRDVVKIDDKEITVKELTVQEVLEIFEADNNMDFLTLAEKHLPKATDLTLEDMKKMTPSELEAVYEKWREVNSAFFKIAGTLGLNSVLAQIKQAIQADFYGLFSDLFNQGTGNASGATDGPHS